MLGVFIVDIVVYLITLAVAYLVGSLPTGYLAGRVKGLDIRTVGSGNIGATNAFRILGTKVGVLVLLVDALKGFCACSFVAPVVVHFFPSMKSQEDYLALAAGVGAILGHNFTCWLRFKGGKGVATSAGVLFALSLSAAGIAVVVWAAVFAVSRYVSLASISAAVSLPVAAWFWHGSSAKFWVFVGLGLMAIIKHKSNIRRLLSGTENRIVARKKNTIE